MSVRHFLTLAGEFNDSGSFFHVLTFPVMLIDYSTSFSMLHASVHVLNAFVWLPTLSVSFTPCFASRVS